MKRTQTRLRMSVGLVAMVAVLALVAFMTMVSTDSGGNSVSAGVPSPPKPGTDGNLSGIYDLEVNPGPSVLKVYLTMHRYGTTTAPWTVAKIKEELAKANKVWSQANIQFTWLNQPTFYDFPDNFPLPNSNGDVDDSGTSSTPEEDAVCSTADTEQPTLKANAFPVVWVQQLLNSSNIGVTIFTGGPPKVPQCLMVGKQAQTAEQGVNKKGETLAHELGHMLLGQGHSNDTNNLMHISAMPTGQKLTPEQITDARAAAQARINAGGGQNVIYHCISRLDHDAGTNLIKSSSQCYVDIHGTGDPAYVLDGVNVPGEGPTAGAGPAPPPPYTILTPTKGEGFFDKTGTSPECQFYFPGAGSCAVTVTCFPDIGAGSLGPNLGVRSVVGDPKGDPSFGKVELYSGRSVVDCDNLVLPPVGSVAALDLKSTRAAVGSVPWRTQPIDFDGDGCSDFNELAKPGARPKGCGDDPYNPLDSFQTVFTGAYDILVRVLRAGDTPGFGGIYFNCLADVQQTGTGKTDGDLTARAYCYTDSFFGVVNALGYPGVTGDGFPGGAPAYGALQAVGAPEANWVGPPAGSCARGLAGVSLDEDGDTVPNDGCPSEGFGDIDSKHTELKGFVENATNTLKLRGCFEDEDASSSVGIVYIEAQINRNTGVGTVDIWTDQVAATCTGTYAWGAYGADTGQGPPVGAFNDAEISVVRQPGGKLRDTDQDGIPNAVELRDDGTSQTPGVGCGLRDPFNPYDWYDVESLAGKGVPDGVIDLLNDILGVINRFQPVVGGAPPYDIAYDRSPVMTGAAGHWNRGAPDGVIDLLTDILGVIQQYHPTPC